MKSSHSFYIKDEYIKKIREEAKKIDRSPSWLINNILEKYLKEKEVKNGKNYS